MKQNKFENELWSMSSFSCYLLILVTFLHIVSSSISNYFFLCKCKLYINWGDYDYQISLLKKKRSILLNLFQTTIVFHILLNFVECFNVFFKEFFLKTYQCYFPTIFILLHCSNFANIILIKSTSKGNFFKQIEKINDKNS